MVLPWMVSQRQCKVTQCPKRPSCLCHVCNAHLPHHLALIYPHPLRFPTVRQPFLLFLPHSHLFSALPLSFFCCATRCRAAAAHRRLSCAPIYKRSREHRSRWAMMIHRPVGDGQRNASPLSEGVALYAVFCGVERFGCLSFFG